MNNCGKLREVSNEVIYWMLPQFQSTKETSVAFTIHKILHGCVEKLYGFKIGDTVGMSIHHGFENSMVMNPTLYVLSIITYGGWKF